MGNVVYAAAILAGGAGTRFWPLSRAGRPKPFIDLFGQGPLISQTTERLFPLVARDGVFYVVGEALRGLTAGSVPGDLAEQIVTEPIARNTLGAVLLAMARVRAKWGDGVLAILPSDHLIPNVEQFQKHMALAYELGRGAIVTLGITPTYPETGFGYIEAAERRSGTGPGALKVKRFAEKPDRETAAAFVASGDFYWNAGIFVFGVEFLRSHLRSLQPEYATAVDALTVEMGKEAVDAAAVRAILEPLPGINIDRAVMERSSEHLLVVPYDYGWSDVGSWDALFDRVPEGVSFVSGDVLEEGSSGNVAVAASDGPQLTLVDVSDLVVVSTRDAVLVTKRGSGQLVGKVVSRLRESGRDELL